MAPTIKLHNLSENSWEVYHPTGKLMFLADDKKKDWYLKKELAIQTSDNSITLTFTPNGEGFKDDDIFGLTPREVKCVCCGGKDMSVMQRHHIIPYMYRKYMPLVYKSKNHHDVVLICYVCHQKYETYANNLKKVIAAEYDVNEKISFVYKSIFNVNMVGERGVYTNIHSYITTILHYSDKVPLKIKLHMQAEIDRFIGKKNANISDINAASKYIESNIDNLVNKPISVGEQVASKITNLDEFVCRWRQHFIDTMKPRFMPVGWDVNRFYLPRLD